MILADDKFVDLDKIIPGSDLPDMEEEPVLKKEQAPQKPEPAPSPAPQTPVQQPPPKQEERQEKQEKKPEQGKPEQKKPEPAKKEPPKRGLLRKGLPGVEEAKPAKKAAKKAVPAKKAQARAETPKKAVPEKKKAAPAKKTPSVMKTRKLQKKEQKKAAARQKPSRHFKPVNISGGKKQGGADQHTSTGRNWVLITLVILAVIAVGVVAYFLVKGNGAEKDSVAAIVNGEPIYRSELINRYNLVKGTVNPFVTEDEILNTTITDKLLLQEAARRGFSTGDQEVRDILQRVMADNNIDEAALRADLKEKNITYEFMFRLYKDTLTINKLINASFGAENVSEEEIRAFYDENRDLLAIPDRVQVRHILIMFSNVSENETYEKAKSVMDQVNADRSNFCSFVKQYTEDAASADTCGEYNFSQTDQLVPEFISAGFSMKPGDLRIVRTQFGYHVLYKVADLPGHTLTFGEVRSQIEPAAAQQKLLNEYKLFVESLWNSASIDVFNGGVLVKRYNEMVPASGSNETASGENASANESAGGLLPSAGSSGSKVTIKAVSETPEGLLAKCLTGSGAKVFVASWSPDAQDQLSFFGEAVAYLSVVECDPESPSADLALCSSVLAKQYPTWPTWQINGTLVEGIQSLFALSRESGCVYAQQ
jgi:flagellar basal body-associated protein FliL